METCCGEGWRWPACRDDSSDRQSFVVTEGACSGECWITFSHLYHGVFDDPYAKSSEFWVAKKGALSQFLEAHGLKPAAHYWVPRDYFGRAFAGHTCY